MILVKLFSCLIFNADVAFLASLSRGFQTLCSPSTDCRSLVRWQLLVNSARGYDRLGLSCTTSHWNTARSSPPVEMSHASLLVKPMLVTWLEWPP